MKVAFVSFFLFVLTQGCLGKKNALNKVAILGQLDDVKRLVEQEKVDVNIKGDYDVTPLMSASQSPDVKPLVEERLAVVKYLIEKGANVNAADSDGNTPLLYATSSKEPGNLAIVKYLVEKGANVKAENKLKNTALHGAATRGQLESVKYLIEKGADINALNKYGNSALLEAADANSLETVKYLVGKGAVVLNDNSYRLLRFSITKNNLEMLKYFIDLSVPVTGAGKDKETPLHTAAEYYKDTLELVQTLVKKGADVNAADNKGRTPAHYAAKSGNWQVLEYLGDNTKANLFAEDNDKKTPLIYATEENWSGHARDYLQSWARKQESQKTA